MTTQYSAATIARCETILHNAGIATIDATVLRAVAATVKQDTAPVRKPIVDNGDDPSIAHGEPRKARKPRAVKAVAKVAAKDAWLSEPATPGQVARINTIENGLGYAASPASMLGTGQDARNLWRSLCNEAMDEGFRVNRKTGELTIA